MWNKHGQHINGGKKERKKIQIMINYFNLGVTTRYILPIDYCVLLPQI